MRLTNSVIGLVSLISWGVFAVLYSVSLPIINEGGGCTGGQLAYTFKQCESLFGFELPRWIQLGSETYVKASIAFGFFVSAIICLVCIIKRQDSEV
ncbi:TPA: hypothetical protein ACPJZV_004676 [Vibrio diabolicus]